MEQDNEHLFRQLDDIVADGLSEDLNLDTAFMLEGQRLHKCEREIFEKVVQKLPNLAPVMRNLYPEGSESEPDLGQVIDALDIGARTLELERNNKLLMLNLRTIVWLVMLMATERINELPERTKVQIQAEILDTRYLPANEKKVFLGIADELFEGQSIDPEDPDQVVVALSALRQEDIEAKKKKVHRARCGQLFDEIFGAYAELRIDPEFIQLRGLTILSIVTMSQPEATIYDGLKASLRQLGITPEEYSKLYAQLWVKYNEACNF